MASLRTFGCLDAGIVAMHFEWSKRMDRWSQKSSCATDAILYRSAARNAVGMRRYGMTLIAKLCHQSNPFVAFIRVGCHSPGILSRANAATNNSTALCNVESAIYFTWSVFA
jgi:hypothetical protein